MITLKLIPIGRIFKRKEMRRKVLYIDINDAESGYVTVLKNGFTEATVKFVDEPSMCYSCQRQTPKDAIIKLHHGDLFAVDGVRRRYPAYGIVNLKYLITRIKSRKFHRKKSELPY